MEFRYEPEVVLTSGCPKKVLGLTVIVTPDPWEGCTITKTEGSFVRASRRAFSSEIFSSWRCSTRARVKVRLGMFVFVSVCVRLCYSVINFKSHSGLKKNSIFFYIPKLVISQFAIYFKSNNNITPTKKKNDTKTVLIYIFYNYISSSLLNVPLLFSFLKYLKLHYKYHHMYLDFPFWYNLLTD